MLEIKIRIDTDNATGVKETLADYLQRFGDVRVVEVREIDAVEQMRLT